MKSKADIDIIVTSWADLTNWRKIRSMNSPQEISQSWQNSLAELWFDLMDVGHDYQNTFNIARQQGFNLNELIRKEALEALQVLWLGRYVTATPAPLEGAVGQIVGVRIPKYTTASTDKRLTPGQSNTLIDRLLEPRLIIRVGEENIGKLVPFSAANSFLEFVDSSVNEAKLRRTIRKLIREESRRNRH